MSKKLYVGNLPFSATDDVLRNIFEQAGAVESAKVITDRYSGRSKGFGFVEMTSDDEATNAISKFNGADFEGRAITVAEARPQEPREPRGDGPRRGGFPPRGDRGGFSGSGRGGRSGGFGGGGGYGRSGAPRSSR